MAAFVGGSIFATSASCASVITMYGGTPFVCASSLRNARSFAKRMNTGSGSTSR